jgi:hypothetical protein
VRISLLAMSLEVRLIVARCSCIKALAAPLCWTCAILSPQTRERHVDGKITMVPPPGRASGIVTLVRSLAASLVAFAPW